jgi:DNA-binding MarR family transcriptional regulator
MTHADYRALSQFRYQIRRFLHFSEEAARAEGLEPQQHQMLLAIQALDETEPPTIGQLAEHLVLRHHSAVGLLDRLEARGLAERLRGDGDRRQVRVRLTDRGAETLRHLSALHQEELRHSGPVLVDALQRIIQRVPVPER